MTEIVTREDVEREINEAWNAARDATGDYAGVHDAERAIVLSNLAIARALLLQAEKMDEMIREFRDVTSGGSGYLEVRTTKT